MENLIGQNIVELLTFATKWWVPSEKSNHKAPILLRERDRGKTKLICLLIGSTKSKSSNSRTSSLTTTAEKNAYIGKKKKQNSQPSHTAVVHTAVRIKRIGFSYSQLMHVRNPHAHTKIKTQINRVKFIQCLNTNRSFGWSVALSLVRYFMLSIRNDSPQNRFEHHTTICIYFEAGWFRNRCHLHAAIRLVSMEFPNAKFPRKSQFSYRILAWKSK